MNFLSLSFDVDFAEFAYNETYNNFLGAWLWNTGNPTGANSTNRVYAGGFRPQTVTPVGWDDIRNPASTTLQWNCSGFGGDVAAFVLLSAGNGPTPIGGGRVIDLNGDFSPFIADPIFTAFLVGGAGSTPAVPNPFAGMPGGPAFTLHYAAVGFISTAGRITDSFTFDF